MKNRTKETRSGSDDEYDDVGWRRKRMPLMLPKYPSLERRKAGGREGGEGAESKRGGRKRRREGMKQEENDDW